MSSPTLFLPTNQGEGCSGFRALARVHGEGPAALHFWSLHGFRATQDCFDFGDVTL